VLATALSEHGGGGLFADLALDLVLNDIVEHARLATGATAAAIALARGGEIVCRATTGANAPDLGVRLEANSGLSGACVQSKKWQRCDDSELDSRVDAQVCRSLGVRSILVFPVVREDELLGVFEIFSPRPNAFSDREIQTLQALSRSIVNNLDRAADAVAPPVPMFPPIAPATPGAAGEIDRGDQLRVEHSRVDQAQAYPAEPDLPLTVSGSLPGTTMTSKTRRRDRWMSILTLTVIAVALFLGWTMGYMRRSRKAVAAQARAVVNATPVPAQAKPPEDTVSSASAAARRDQPSPESHLTTPVSQQPSGSGLPPVGGLVVYDKGKVIFQAPPQNSRTSSKEAASQPVRVPSKIADQYLIERVEPEYPESARKQGIQGPVVLEALVSRDGAVEKLSTISGDSQLVAAATDAVRQWRFKPFVRNGSPEKFQTQITVSFRLP